MSTITTKDGVEIFYKDWGKGQPIVFSHGWPLSADDWDNADAVLPRQRLSASSPMTAAATADLPRRATAMTWITMRPTSPPSPSYLDLKDAIHVGHSTGGGEVTALSGTARRKPRRKGSADQRGAAA